VCIIVIVGESITDLTLREDSETPLSQETNQLTEFHDEGTYKIVDGKTGEMVEIGEFFVDTKIVELSYGVRNWEIQLRLPPETDIVISEREEYEANHDSAYAPQGRIYVLWNEKDDPQGDKSRQVHDLVVSRAKSGTREVIISQQVKELKDKIDSATPTLTMQTS